VFSYDVIQKMNETELGVYKYIVAHIDKIPYMTVRELAEETGLSTSSVLRFCNKVGFDRYAEFKDYIKAGKKNMIETPPREDLKNILHYMMCTNTGAFETKINSAVKLIRNADTVIFAGQGSSGTLAKYGARYFTNLGKFAIGLEDTWYPACSNFPRGGALIVLSESGETEEVVNMSVQYQKRKFTVLSITNSPDSTLAKLSDWNISYNMEHERTNDGYNATTQVPVLFIIEAIARRLSV
jgi:DNA-binding MurR/RpiR family transcriptional regulator